MSEDVRALIDKSNQSAEHNFEDSGRWTIDSLLDKT